MSSSGKKESIKQTARKLQFQFGDKQPTQQRQRRTVRLKSRQGLKVRYPQRRDIFSSQ